ncbi:DUF2158 domain-containing protein [Pleionea sediminis]|uniref:DUF2158 domain-containing protein n=1 Tax=Pleionea sediminis TaxID=2569479 RepID=UPI001186F4E0|nr:DUF2158 domain-containing protein [Pleionea sediminis]
MRRGDIVQLSSGGLKMTVFSNLKDLPSEARDPYLSKGYDNEDVVCKWFVGTTLKKEVFRSEVLKQIYL